MKNWYLNLAFVFGSVAVDDDMHFKNAKLERTESHPQEAIEDFHTSTFWGRRVAGSAAAQSTPLTFINAYLFLTSAANWGGWSASRPGSITPGEENSDTHRIGTG
jgi:hypothetical protein